MAKMDKLMEQARVHLDTGERIVGNVLGAYETKVLGKDSMKNGVFLATDKRLVFFAKKMFGYDMESFPYSNISSFEMSKGLLGHTIAFFASGNHAKMKWIKVGDVNHFVSYVKSQMGKKATEQPQVMAGNDIAEQIRKLADLRDKGIVTEEEFQTKKTEMLSRL
jgi:hypothetical protein